MRRARNERAASKAYLGERPFAIALQSISGLSFAIWTLAYLQDRHPGWSDKLPRWRL